MVLNRSCSSRPNAKTSAAESASAACFQPYATARNSPIKVVGVARTMFLVAAYSCRSGRCVSASAPNASLGMNSTTNSGDCAGSSPSRNRVRPASSCCCTSGGTSAPCQSFAASIATGSWPSQSNTSQPEAAKRAFWSVASDSDTLPSMVMPLSSHSTISRDSWCRPAMPSSGSCSTRSCSTRTVATDSNRGGVKRIQDRRPQAQGLIGPNLTDDRWIHGGSVEQVFQSVAKGWPAKGMPPWGRAMKPEELSAVVSYVRSLQGSNPPNAKAPEGEEPKA